MNKKCASGNNCVTGNAIQNVSFFNKNKSTADGYSNECRACHRVYNLKWYHGFQKGMPKPLRDLQITPEDCEQIGYVYFVAADDKAIKIGCTTNEEPLQRLKSLQTGSYLPLKIIGLMLTENCYGLESRLHDYFEHLHLRGEWYKFSEQIIDMIASYGLMCSLGLPSEEKN